jgi:hypothetical protein
MDEVALGQGFLLSSPVSIIPPRFFTLIISSGVLTTGPVAARLIVSLHRHEQQTIPGPKKGFQKFAMYFLAMGTEIVSQGYILGLAVLVTIQCMSLRHSSRMPVM